MLPRVEWSGCAALLWSVRLLLVDKMLLLVYDALG
jgi:hypothetical protein